MYFCQDQSCFKSVVRLTIGHPKFNSESLVLQWNLQCLVKGNKIAFKSQGNTLPLKYVLFLTNWVFLIIPFYLHNWFNGHSSLFHFFKTVSLEFTIYLFNLSHPTSYNPGALHVEHETLNSILIYPSHPFCYFCHTFYFYIC